MVIGNINFQVNFIKNTRPIFVFLEFFINSFCKFTSNLRGSLLIQQEVKKLKNLIFQKKRFIYLFNLLRHEFEENQKI